MAKPEGRRRGPSDDRRSLEQIERDVWGEPEHPSRLVRTVHALRRRPIGELGIEDLRLLIGQQVGVEALVPRALSVLERDPLAAGDLYAGGLLAVVLRLPAQYWETHRAERRRLEAVISAVRADHRPETRSELPADVRTAVENFAAPEGRP